MGDVLQFPTVRSCFLCQHHRLGEDSTSYCELFDERIDSEVFSARDCAGYEPG